VHHTLLPPTTQLICRAALLAIFDKDCQECYFSSNLTIEVCPHADEH
jgi:hypothetical protein